jgi:hypothetical protein
VRGKDKSVGRTKLTAWPAKDGQAALSLPVPSRHLILLRLSSTGDHRRAAEASPLPLLDPPIAFAERPPLPSSHRPPLFCSRRAIVTWRCLAEQEKGGKGAKSKGGQSKRAQRLQAP